MRRRLALIVVIAGLVGPTLAGCGACTAFGEAYVRGSNMRSMLTIKEVAIALERHRQKHGSYPTAKSIAELWRGVAPLLDNAACADRWGEALVVDVEPESYTLTSKGDDRVGGHEFGGAVTVPGHSITLKDARFVQYDASVEKTARKYEAEIAGFRSRSAAGE